MRPTAHATALQRRALCLLFAALLLALAPMPLPDADAGSLATADRRFEFACHLNSLQAGVFELPAALSCPHLRVAFTDPPSIMQSAPALPPLLPDSSMLTPLQKQQYLAAFSPAFSPAFSSGMSMPSYAAAFAPDSAGVGSSAAAAVAAATAAAAAEAKRNLNDERRPWTRQEDAIVREMVGKHGTKK